MDCRNIDAIRAENERLLAEAKAKDAVSYGELRALALSLAEALSDAVPVLDHAGRTHFDAVWRLIKAQAALSSPALLKLKGGV